MDRSHPTFRDPRLFTDLQKFIEKEKLFIKPGIFSLNIRTIESTRL
jgi:hypothetical protein